MTREQKGEKKGIHTCGAFRIESAAYRDVYSGLQVGWVFVPRGSDFYKKAVAAAGMDMIPNISKCQYGSIYTVRASLSIRAPHALLLCCITPHHITSHHSQISEF